MATNNTTLSDAIIDTVAEEFLDRHVNNESNELVIDYNLLFTHPDNSEDLHEWMRELVTGRPTMDAVKGIAALTATHNELSRDIGQHRIVDKKLQEYAEGAAEMIDDEDIDPFETPEATADLLRILLNDYLYDDDRFTTDYMNSYRVHKRVNALIAERGITITADTSVVKNHFDALMHNYGNDVIEKFWFAPMQVDNHNTEGEIIGRWIEKARDLIDDWGIAAMENADDVREVVESTPEVITHLFISQGYVPDQLFCAQTRSNSAFLRSFATEMDNLVGDSPLLGFLTVTLSLAASDMYDLLRGTANHIVVTPAAQQTAIWDNGAISVGLFDPTMGSGSIMEIELEHPWVIPCDTTALAVNFRGLHSGDNEYNDYGYNPFEVYDFYFPKVADVTWIER